MQCPKCGAHNPDGAINCNLCFAKFYEEPKRAVSEAEGPELAAPDAESAESALEIPEEPAAKTGGIDWPATLKRAGEGGLAAAGGAAFFLVSIGLARLAGLQLMEFLFAGRLVLVFNLSIFLMTMYLFALMSGGVFGNVRERPNLVLTRRLVAATIGLACWLVVLYAAIIRNAGSITVTSGLSTYTIVELSGFALTASLIAFSDGMDAADGYKTSLYQAAGGLAGAVIAMVNIIVSMLTLGWIVSMAPETGAHVVAFFLRLAVNVLTVAFVIGAAFWFGTSIGYDLAQKK